MIADGIEVMAARLARRYQVRLGPAGEVEINLPAQPGEPLAPLLIYAGGEHALLRRDAETDVVLDFIHPDARRPLSLARQVVFAEGPGRRYAAAVGMVETLPAWVRELLTSAKAAAGS